MTLGARPLAGDLARAILPAGVVTAEALDDETGQFLFPSEEALVASAVPARRREFATGRACARSALAELGRPAAAIGRDGRGAPIWPTGVIGALTHCAGYRAAAVALERDFEALGLDAEPHEPLPAEVLDLVTLPSERLRLAELVTRETGVGWDRILFSAKESVYKCWYPATGEWLDFTSVDVAIDPDAGTFSARLCGVRPPGAAWTPLTGRWLVRDGLVLTAIAVPRRAGSAL